MGRSWWRRLLGFTAARGMDGIRGSAGRFKGASAGISASAPEFGKPARFAGGRPVCARRLREEEDGPGAWGRAGSGKGETRRCERAVRARWARVERRRSGPRAEGAGAKRAVLSEWAAGIGKGVGHGKKKKRFGPSLFLGWTGL